jgi:hypothetical protein
VTYRCVNAFDYDNKVYPGGVLVADDHSILDTHAQHFAKVDELTRGVETASAAPGEQRAVPPAKKAHPASKAAAKTPPTKPHHPSEGKQ